MGDDVAEGAGVGALGPYGVGVLGELGGARALQEHRVGEPFDLLLRHSCGGGHLLHGRSGADTSLDLTWSQLTLQLDRDLSEPGQVAPGGSAQPLVGGHGEALASIRIFEDDLAALVDPDDPQRPHRRPPRSDSPSG